jgi:hypothetical protein
MADNGSINHCVRWNTALTPPLPTATKTEGSAALFTAGSILLLSLHSKALLSQRPV